MQLFSAEATMFLKKNFKLFFDLENIKKKHPKKLDTYDSWEFFFSAALTAQNSPELHFCFINSFIRPSRVESLPSMHTGIVVMLTVDIIISQLF